MRTILFYAPLGYNMPKSRIGGAEMGCRKTKQVYETAGIKVVTIDKPNSVNGKILFLVKILFLPIRIFFLLKFYGTHTPLHIVGFYYSNVNIEVLLMRIAHFCGNNVIYEPRNGAMIHSYNSGTGTYKRKLENCFHVQMLSFVRG